MPRPLLILATEQFEKEFDSIKTPSQRRTLTKELTALLDEIKSGGPLPASREESELAGWPECHFAYLKKPYGLVFRLHEDQLQLLRLALDAEILLF